MSETTIVPIPKNSTTAENDSWILQFAFLHFLQGAVLHNTDYLVTIPLEHIEELVLVMLRNGYCAQDKTKEGDNAEETNESNVVSESD